jgi:hypothetical protein
MLVRRLRTLRIRRRALWILDPELLADEHRHAARNRGRILAQKRAKHPHRAPLNRESHPVLLATLARKQLQRLVVELEEPL